MVAPGKPHVKMAIAEIVGAAGAGKTTLLARLDAASQDVEPLSDLKALSNVSPYLRAVRQSLPYLFPSDRAHGNPLPFAAWHRANRVLAALSILRGRSESTKRLVIADQGPLYGLMTLLPYATASAQDGVSGCSPTWWTHLLAEVASGLDFVIWIDADELTLLHRIRCRIKEHRVKQLPDREALSYLRAQRRAYRKIIEGLQVTRGPRVLRCDDCQVSGSTCLDLVLALAAGLES